MITTLPQLQTELLSQADLEQDPIFKRPYLLTSPGCSNERFSFLQQNILGLPKSFANLLPSYSFNGVIIDEFELSPHSFRDLDIVEGLLKSIEDPFFPKEFMEKHRMYQIGSYNTDLVCVTAGTGQFKEGEILFVEEGYDIYNPQDDQIHPLAKDFEQFLIVAGNLNEIHREIKEDNSNWEEKKNEFIERLRILGVDENYHKAWLNVF